MHAIFSRNSSDKNDSSLLTYYRTQRLNPCRFLFIKDACFTAFYCKKFSFENFSLINKSLETLRSTTWQVSDAFSNQRNQFFILQEVWKFEKVWKFVGSHAGVVEYVSSRTQQRCRSEYNVNYAKHYHVFAATWKLIPTLDVSCT
jgi:hypothetical protein